MLHDDDFNVREYVVQVLLKVVPVLTVDVAVRCDIERTMNITNHVHTYHHHHDDDRDDDETQLKTHVSSDDHCHSVYVCVCMCVCSVMTEADRSGMAAVITCAQEEAEEYCTGLRSNGLTSTIEPAGGGGASEG